MSRTESGAAAVIALNHGAGLRVALLGPLEVVRDGSRLNLSGPKRRALLTLLALNAGEVLSPERIVEALWGDRSTGREESTLRVHISHLRSVLEPDRETDPRVIVTRGSGYMLSPESVELDIAHFDRLIDEARAAHFASSPRTALGLINEALSLWRGRPLHDVEYEEFAQEEIRRLYRTRINVLEDRAGALIEVGEDAAAIEDLEALVREEPGRERPVLLLMRALYRTGRQPEALRVARRHRRTLADQGLEASPVVEDLEERILRHDPELLPEGVISPADIKPGRSVRGYELREEAGAGSLGVVYRAFQASVGREVALKAIHPRFAGTREFIRRFAEEARVVAGLEHPHIVPLYDFWRDPVGAFLVMRWMDGGSMAERTGKPWDPSEIGRAFAQLADALGYAHGAGVVHRDVKPTNVLFDQAGNAYLGDFGLAVPVVDAGGNRRERFSTSEPPYASPEVLRGEAPTIASDVFSLGALVAEAATGSFHGEQRLQSGMAEVVAVATSSDPADRYPDASAFRSALVEVVGTTPVPVPRRVRRNPYKGLSPFSETDQADFYGRDDVVESLLDLVGTSGLTAVIGASGSGKSSLVMAGLIPQLTSGALPGSDEWSIVSMVPGADPFEEFHIGLRSAAVGRSASDGADRSRELRQSFASALDGPQARALLVVDQFEELFSSQVDDRARRDFLDNLTDLALDPTHHVRIALTLRADFADRPLAHPRFGDLISRSSLLLAPMRPEQLEDVIRRPARRVGVEVEPGLIAEIVRDVAAAPAYLPLLQYLLSELFERRHEDRLTVNAYRSLGRVQGVLERRAEATFSSLDEPARRGCRQLFLRLVRLGDQGEETRRRLPLNELHGLGERAAVEDALDAFSRSRLLTYDRDPITRNPTVEVAHETVIQNWSRFRVWIDEARAELLAHRRLSAAAAAWDEADRDEAYLLTGGPLAAAVELTRGSRLQLNAQEASFVTESRRADQQARARVEDQRRRETLLQHRARRRLAVGIGAAAVAAVVAVAAGFAWVERQRANDLAAAQQRQSLGRELAAASVGSLTSADPDLSLLLAIEGAELSMEAGEEILPEVVDALHRAVINPRPDLIVEGGGTATGGQLLDFAHDGAHLVRLAGDGGAEVLDPVTGDQMGEIPGIDPPAFAVDFHPDGESILTIHTDGVRQWNWRSGELEVEVSHDVDISCAVYSPDGSSIAVGDDGGGIRIWTVESGDAQAELVGHRGRVTSVDFDHTGTRLVSTGEVEPMQGEPRWTVVIWEIASETELVRAREDRFVAPIFQSAWSPTEDAIAVTTHQGETFVIDPASGERLTVLGNVRVLNRSIAFDSTGTLAITASTDGFARVYSRVGGEPALVLPTGGVPLRDAASDLSGTEAMATVDANGSLRVWRDVLGSELPERNTFLVAPHLAATPDGRRYVVTATGAWFGIGERVVPTTEVVDSATGESLLQLPPPQLPQLRSPRAAISSDGTRIAVSGDTGELEIVDIATASSTLLEGSAAWGASLAFSPDGSLLAAGGREGTIAVWDTDTAEPVTLLQGHGEVTGADIIDTAPNPVQGTVVTFRPDGSKLASTGVDGAVRVWDLVTGEGAVIHQFQHIGISVAYSPDGSMLAAADSTGDVVLLEPASGTPVLAVERVSGATFVAFSADGRHLAGAGPQAYLWDVETGRIIRRFSGNAYPNRNVAFVNEGRELLVMSGEGIERRYVLEPERLVELAREEAKRKLTEEECRQYLRRPCGA